MQTQPESTTPQKSPSYRTLFGNRSFSTLWLAQIVSQSGDAVFDVALLLFVYNITHSIFLVGLTQAVVLLPGVFAGPIAGVYADKLNRRDIMIVSNVVQGAITTVVAALYVTANLGYSIILVLVLLLYTAAQFYLAANGAIIPKIVSKENLGAANSLFTLSTSTNQLIGYSVGGVVVASFGYAIPITYDALTFLFAAGLLGLIARSYGQSRQVEAAVPAATPSGPSFWTNFREGLAYVRQDKLFLQLIVFGLLVNGFGGATFALLVPYAKQHLQGGTDSTYGFLLSAFLLGTIIGSIVVGKVNFRNYVGKFLFSGIIIFGVLLSILGLVTTIPIALVVFFTIGSFIAIVNVPISTLIQTHIPGELLGRTTTVLRALLSASQPIAAVLAGTIASLLSITTVFIGSGLVVAIGTGVLYLVFAELRSAKY